MNIPQKPGSYQFYNNEGEIIYIGKAANLKNRVLSYWQKSASHTPAKYSMLKQIGEIRWIETDSEIEALLLESNLIKKHQPPFNILMRDDKRYVYVKISLEDEVPGVFMTRKLDKSGKYFGPFVSVQAVRETLKAIRKIWPYCTMHKRQAKPCFHYQINLCTGICAGLIERKEYLEKVIRPIMLFFEGKKKKIVADYERDQKLLKKQLQKFSEENLERFETEKKLKSLESKLSNIHRVLEHAAVLSVGEKYANDVVELAKILSLTKVPQRIEGYDIANIFGREAVGSMVVFSGGEPDKNEYRKFKIRIGQGEANDIRMLKEVLERRFSRHAGMEKKGEAWPLPDLIVIDGGRAQLNAAVSILKRNKIDIPVISISKGEGLRSAIARDKLFFPGQKNPLELPLASPALHLIKRVRDEAHRFAISYHRQLRGKNFLR